MANLTELESSKGNPEIYSTKAGQIITLKYEKLLMFKICKHIFLVYWGDDKQ